MKTPWCWCFVFQCGIIKYAFLNKLLIGVQSLNINIKSLNKLKYIYKPLTGQLAN